MAATSSRLVFNGANINERMDISANGARARLTRDVANITMDLDGIENIQVNALGGADTITVNDLTGTDAKQVNIDLSGTVGSGQGDGAADNVIVNGTAGDDTVTVASSGAGVVVNGLAAKVTLAGTEGALDSLTVNGSGGNDTINASALKAGQINLTIVWNPGDGSDTVDGQAGSDTLLFNGANINENIDISANGSRARLTRDVGNVTMDLNGVEHIEVNARGSADTVTVNDLTGTGVNQVAIDLGAQPGSPGGDGAADTIVINATNGNDAITIVNNNGIVTVSGLPEAVTISNFEANDRIVINGLGGDDAIVASGLTGMLLTANGGDGDDVLVGSAGNDTLNGGNGDDVLIGGPGQDTLDGGPGNNILIQDGGSGPNIVPPTGSSPAGSVALLGQFMASTFVTDGGGQGATPVADPHANQPPWLAQPHA